MQINKKLVYLLAGLFVVACCWYILASRNDVSDIQQRADAVRDQLGTAQQEQRDQAEALERAESAADRSQQAVRDSQETTSRIEDIERSDGEIIRECKSILEAVRGRGEAENQG